MPPADLLATGRAEVTGYGVEIIEDVVLSIDPGFAVRLGHGQVLSARRILVATGVGDEIPDIPGVRERWGQDLLHCPYCHGWEVRDQRLGVLGSNPGSILHAQLVRQWSDDVVYFAHTQEPTPAEATELDARGIRVVHGEVTRLVVEDDPPDRRRAHRRASHLPVRRVRPTCHHAAGRQPARQSRLRDRRFAVVDGTGRTSTPGVWGAGNAVDPRAQVITAAGTGSAVAIAINADLVQDDIVGGDTFDFEQGRSVPVRRRWPRSGQPAAAAVELARQREARLTSHPPSTGDARAQSQSRVRRHSHDLPHSAGALISSSTSRMKV